MMNERKIRMKEMNEKKLPNSSMFMQCKAITLFFMEIFFTANVASAVVMNT